MDNLGYLFAAYTIIWIGLCVLVFDIMRKQKKNRQDIETLKDKIEK